MRQPDHTDLLALTAQIVSAHCASNTVPADDLPSLIHQIHAALAAAEPSGEPAAAAAPTPAVPIRRSVFPDHIVCLEDGKKLKMLKRYLRSTHGMTPDQYRKRWGAAVGLSDGSAELCPDPQQAGQADRTGTQGGRVTSDGSCCGFKTSGG